MEILLNLALALLVGLMLSRLAKLAQLPAVTAYLVAGILIGPSCLGALGIAIPALPDACNLGFHSLEDVEHLSLICDVALGFIAFSIGNEFRLGQLKQIGKQATIIGILQAVVTTLLVDAALIGLSFAGLLPIEAAIVLGAVAAATAPAATLMVVRQYKAKGPLTDILLPVVALDDAVGLVLFAISFGVAKGLAAEGGANIISIVVDPLLEIALSLLLGAAMGFVITFFERFFHSRSKRLAISVGFVLLTVALSKFSMEIGPVHIAISPLLTCMMLGTMFCNTCDFSEELMDRLDRWTAPLFILFFVLSGAELDLTVFSSLSMVLIGVVYILVRSAGKYAGALGSAKLAGSDKNIVNYLGITLLPQAGVALGMAQKAQEAFGPINSEIGLIISNITLMAVLVYELIGPMLTKMALLKAGDIKPEGKTSAREQAKQQMEAAREAAAEAELSAPQQ